MPRLCIPSAISQCTSFTLSPSTYRPIYLISSVLKTGYAIRTEINVSSSPTSPPNNPIFLAAGAIYYNHNKQVNTDGSRIDYPSLSHSEERNSNPNKERCCSSETPRHSLLVLPSTQIIAAETWAEPEMLNE